MKEEALKAIEAKLDAMTTDDYRWGDSNETHDRTGTCVEYHCEHENGLYEYSKNIDRGRRTSECVSVDGACFVRTYGERDKQWHGFTTRYIDEGYGWTETMRFHATEAMVKALDKISKIHSR